MYVPKLAATKGQVFAGIDLGRESDYTVATFIDSDGQVIEIYRDNQKDWSYMITEILHRAKKYNARLMVETNSMGTVVQEQLKRQWQNTEGFTTTNKSKQEIIEGLILDFHERSPSLSQALSCFQNSRMN